MDYLASIYKQIEIGHPFFFKLDFVSSGNQRIETPLQELTFLYVEKGRCSFNVQQEELHSAIDEGELFICLTYGAAPASSECSIELLARANGEDRQDCVAYAGGCSLEKLGWDGLAAALPRCMTVRLESAERAAMGALLNYGVALIGKNAVATRSRAETQIAQVVASMRAKLGHAWTLEQLAAQTSMSRSTFLIRFKHAMDCPPFEYLTKLRIQKAQEMLACGAYELHQIAETVGYGSESAFCRVFKRSTGQPPIAWQRACRNGVAPFAAV